MNDDRQTPQVTPDINPRHLRFGPYEVDLRTEELRKDGVRLKLGSQPFQVLVLLLAQPGDLVTREELQRNLWTEGTFTDWNHGLNAAVNKLRETLSDTAAAPKYIETLPRRGYRFVGKLETEALPTVVEEPKMPTLPSPARSWFPIRQILAKHSRAVPIILAGVLCGSVLLALLGKPKEPAQNLSSTRDLQTTAEEASRKALAEKQAPEHEPGSADASVTRASFREPGPLRTAPVFRTVITGEGGNAAPQFSPDGRLIAFMSNRSGPWQIWVSNVDGSNPRQVSFTESAGTPRWSPDGRSITFDAPSSSGTSIYVARLDERGSSRELVEGRVPSFSRDGRWIYFASERSGNWQVWKIPVTGGTPQQATHNGGFAALESTDGYLYYSKSPGNDPQVCRTLLAGGDENCALPHLRPRTWSSWAVTRIGIMFVEELPDGRSTLSVYQPDKHQVRDLVSLQSAPAWIGATVDGSRAVVNDRAEQQISVVDNLR